MEYNAGIKPAGARVVVYPIPIERKTASGIILHDTSADREDMAQVEAIVIAIGPLCWADQPIKQPWCAIGDKIVIGKYRGLVRKGPDGKTYRIISDLDVVGVCHD